MFIDTEETLLFHVTPHSKQFKCHIFIDSFLMTIFRLPPFHLEVQTARYKIAMNLVTDLACRQVSLSELRSHPELVPQHSRSPMSETNKG